MGFWSSVGATLEHQIHDATAHAARELQHLRDHPAQDLAAVAKAGYNAVIGDDLHTLTNTKASWGERALAAVSIASNFVGPEGKLLTKGGELVVKTALEHGGERLLQSAIAHVRGAVSHEAIELVERATPRVASALAHTGSALESTIKAVNVAHNGVVAAADLPDAARRTVEAYSSARDTHLSAAERVHAVEALARGVAVSAHDVVAVGKAAVGAHHGAQRLHRLGEDVHEAAGKATRHLAGAAEKTVDRGAAALTHAVSDVAKGSRHLVADVDGAVHRMTSYVAHAANDVVHHATREAYEAIRHVPLGGIVREAQHELSATARDASHAANRAIGDLREAVDTAADHAEKHLAQTIATAATSTEHRIEAARGHVTERLHAASEPHAAHGPTPPHAPGPVERALHTAAERLTALGEPVTSRIEHVKEHATEAKDRLLAKVDGLTHGHASHVAGSIASLQEVRKDAHDHHEAREAAASALERMTPEARDRAERSGPAQIGRPHLEATPWNGRGGVPAGSVSSVLGDRVEQYTGRGGWVTFDKHDLSALKKALHDNGLDHDPSKPTKIAEGDRLEVSDKRITLMPHDPSQQRVSIRIGPDGTSAVTMTSQLGAQHSFQQQAPQHAHAAGRP